MARGGGFGSGKKQGPDLSWADEDLDDPNDPHNKRDGSPPTNVPAPTFPTRYNIRTPKPLSTPEKNAVSAQLQFRERCRASGHFAVRDAGVLLAEGSMNSGKKKSEQEKEAKRRGFDPFEQQERYSTRLVKRARTEPDIAYLGPAVAQGRGDYGYTLQMFPEELWGVLDPGRKLPAWEGMTEDSVAVMNLPGRKTKVKSAKRKRKEALDFDRLDRERALAAGAAGAGEDAENQDDSDDEDPVRGAADRKRRRKEKKDKPVGTRRGMEAEDEFDPQDPEDEDAEDGGEEEPVDSDFEDESDDAADDYNAEQYFSGGEDGDLDDGGGGDDDF